MEQYIGFLKEAYHHVKHTVPLFMNCGGRLTDEYEWLREAISEYIQEEIGHQEWILNDLGVCGADKEAMRNSAPDINTEIISSTNNKYLNYDFFNIYDQNYFDKFIFNNSESKETLKY